MLGTLPSIIPEITARENVICAGMLGVRVCRVKIDSCFRIMFGALFFAVLGLCAFKASAGCSEGAVTLRGSFGQTSFSVEIADTARERAIGLMHRLSLPAREGMIFFYPAPGPVAFWMRNTLIPLDMLFIAPDGRITKIHKNAVPLDETPIHGGDQVLAVLEINGGLSQKLGIKAGNVVRHPGFDQKIAAWPCEN